MVLSDPPYHTGINCNDRFVNTQNTRLITLRVMVKLMALLALGAVFWVLFASVPVPDSREAPKTRFNISDMQPGEARQVVCCLLYTSDAADE